MFVLLLLVWVIWFAHEIHVAPEGEEIPGVGLVLKVKLSPDYWDCECILDYIHPNTEDKCPYCEALRIDQPPSRVDEVEEWRKKRLQH